MLDIAPCCNPVQYQGKLTNRIWEIGKKPIFEPNFNLLSQNLGPQIFFGGIYLNLKEVLPAIILYDVEEN